MYTLPLALWLLITLLPAIALGGEGQREQDNRWCAEKFNQSVTSAPEGRRFALAMSGGGYRAMLYHIGALRRLNESGLLAEVAVVSSVSGGSITAGMLAKAWNGLEFVDRGTSASPMLVARNLKESVEDPLRELARTTIDVPSVIGGFFPGGSAADRLAEHYGDGQRFGDVRLSDLQNVESSPLAGPALRIPEFIFNATNLQTGELWQFRPQVMGGPVVHWTDPGEVKLAHAVAASSAFPPFLSPLYLRPDKESIWRDCATETHVHATDPRLHTGRSIEPGEEADFRAEVFLTDGGVRDNLGLVSLLQINRKRSDRARHEFDLLVSDAGRSYGPERNPATNWLLQSYRILGISTAEPDLLRIESLVFRAVDQDDEKAMGTYCTQQASEDWPRWQKDLCLKADAAYWSSERVPPVHVRYDRQPSELIMREDIRQLGRIPTRLHEMSETQQGRLINWGYLSADYALPFLNRLWKAEEIWKLKLCKELPHPEAGMTGRPVDKELCVSITH